jgi:RND family efflux transporter MFP subunit
MIRSRFGINFVALAVGAAAANLAGCGPAPTLAPTEPPVVTVSKPLERPIVDYDQYTGRLEAAETVEVRARVRGELTDIHFQDGAFVNAGDLLFKIDPRTYKAELAIAEALKANAEASLKLATAEYQRAENLVATKSISASEVDTWAAKKATALAQVSQAIAQIEKEKLEVDFCTIKAPISGRIGRPLVTKGNMVNAGGGETLLTTIVSVDPIFVYFDVDERSLQLYRERRAKELGAEAKGKPPVIPVFLGLVTDGDRFPLEGKIDFTENQLNPATGTIRVRGVFANKEGRLTPGQFGRVKLPVGEKYEGLLVADTAIGIDQGQKYLLIVNDQKKAEYRPVTPGRLDGDLRIFPPGAGLKAGEWVIVNGVQRVRPGIEVRPEPVEMPTRSADPKVSNAGKTGGEKKAN